MKGNTFAKITGVIGTIYNFGDIQFSSQNKLWLFYISIISLFQEKRKLFYLIAFSQHFSKSARKEARKTKGLWQSSGPNSSSKLKDQQVLIST